MGPDSGSTPNASDALGVTWVRAFSDNYVWIVHGRGARDRRVAVVDPGDAAPVRKALDSRGLTLDSILVTHHHADHVGGVLGLLSHSPVPVYGPARESIPGRTAALSEGDEVVLEGLGLRFRVLDIPGHTAGHIAYYGHGALFSGDTLFSAGCGRLFEGTAPQMLASLDKLQALPSETRVYCGHEYTAQNLKFAAAVEPGNEAVEAYSAEVAVRRATDGATLPSTLGLEGRVNPFLRTRLPSVRRAAAAHAGRAPGDDGEAFAQVRSWKDGFRA